MDTSLPAMQPGQVQLDGDRTGVDVSPNQAVMHPSTATAGVWDGPVGPLPASNAVAAPVINVATHVNVGAPAAPVVLIHNGPTGPGFLVRAVWYVFVGWWLSALVIVLGYVAAATIIGLPLAFGLFNRVPQAMTLRPRSTRWSIETVDGVTRVSQGVVAQRPWWARATYFVCVGLWVGAVWMVAAWLLCALILPMPLGLWMLDRTSAVLTLQRH